MQFAMEELTEAFAQETGLAAKMVVGSSGKLTAQIIAGAPYDVFLSADIKYPEMLHSKGLTKGNLKNYAEGKLVLWSLKENVSPSMESLSNKNINRIAIANPDLAPYGSAAMEELKASNDYAAIEDKLVIGESISQVNQFVVSGAADIGFTAKSVVLSLSMNGKGKWVEVNSGLHKPIIQSAVVIKRGTDKNKQSEQFVDFLFSEGAKKILTKFGYSVVEE
ncbi:MAG: molybdate ABC transporter substrate-binding protein [Cyclobacteriaceae bacterium]